MSRKFGEVECPCYGTCGGDCGEGRVASERNEVPGEDEVWTEEKLKAAAEKFMKEHIDREDFQGLYASTFIAFARIVLGMEKTNDH